MGALSVKSHRCFLDRLAFFRQLFNEQDWIVLGEVPQVMTLSFPSHGIDCRTAGNDIASQTAIQVNLIAARCQHVILST